MELKRVLVTGAGGFIGRQVIAPLMALGYEVHAISRSELGMPSVCGHRVDLFDIMAVSTLLDTLRPTHLVHLAWYTQPPSYWQSPLNESWLQMSSRLIDSFARCGGKRLVVAGTCAEYEWGSDILSEDRTPERPATPYGVAKLALRNYTASAAKQMGLSFAWARFFFLFGPHERVERFVPSIIEPLLRGRVAQCRNGRLIRDFLYVKDAGDAVAAVLHSDAEGTVNIASGVASSLGTIAQAIGVAMRRPDLVHVESKEATGREPTTLVADVTRLRSEIGWTPRHDLLSALDETIACRSAELELNAI